MSTAEWNVLGLLLTAVGILMMLHFGMPTRAGGRRTGWIGLVLFLVGTLCQIWANVRWVG